MVGKIAEQNKRDGQVILRDVLQIITGNSDPQTSLRALVDAACSIFSAAGAALLIFNDPRLLITAGVDESALPSDDISQSIAAGLSPGVHLSPELPDGVHLSFPAWAAAQIRIQRQVVGLLWLFFDSPPAMNDDLVQDLQTIINGITVVTMNARLIARHEKLGRNQSEFMRIVSHDLRSPLTSIKGFASMLESGMVGELNEKQAHFIDKILSGIMQMASLVDNIQDAGRYDPENGFYSMERTHVDITEIARRIVDNHLVPAEKGELTITTRFSDEVPIINADANMLERAIINLVDNAIKYTPNGGRIEVGVYRRGDAIIVSVSDTGYGISPENQKLLFERHVRIPRQEHKRIKGSGLGLFIVRSVAQRHNGKAWVESSVGQGSTFFISIPLDEANSILATESEA